MREILELCFSLIYLKPNWWIWYSKEEKETGRTFSWKISWASQKIKIMFHVFQYGGGGGLRIFPSPKAYIEGENVYHYELTCWVLMARVWGGRQTLAFTRSTAVSLQGEFGAYMEETEEWQLATGCNQRRGKLKLFLNPKAYIEAELRIFPSPRA